MTNERFMPLLVLVIAAIVCEVGAQSLAERVVRLIALGLAFAVAFGTARLIGYLGRRFPG